MYKYTFEFFLLVCQSPGDNDCSLTLCQVVVSLSSFLASTTRDFQDVMRVRMMSHKTTRTPSNFENTKYVVVRVVRVEKYFALLMLMAQPN